MTISTNGLIAATLFTVSLLFSTCNCLEELQLRFTQRLPGEHIRTVVPVTIMQCHGECLARKMCKSFNYFDKLHLCKLMEWDTQNHTLEDCPGCIYAEKRSWKERTLSDQCDIECKDTEVCKLNPDNSVFCVVSECIAPATVDRAQVLGNMLHAGAKVLYQCDSQSELDLSVPDPVVTSECLPNGTWSAVSIVCRSKDKYVYAACVIDSGKSIFKVYTSIPYMTTVKCYSFCKSKGTHLTYFGTQQKKYCFCGGTLAYSEFIQAPNTECNQECGGSASEICGGYQRMSVYQIKA